MLFTPKLKKLCRRKCREDNCRLLNVMIDHIESGVMKYVRHGSACYAIYYHIIGATVNYDDPIRNRLFVKANEDCPTNTYVNQLVFAHRCDRIWFRTRLLFCGKIKNKEMSSFFFQLFRQNVSVVERIRQKQSAQGVVLFHIVVKHFKKNIGS